MPAPTAAGSRAGPFLRRRLAFLLAGVAMLTVAGYLGAFHWSLDLASHFRVHYGATALALGTGLLVLGSRRLAGLALVTALANGAALVPLYGEPAPPAAGEALGVVQFNAGVGNPGREAIADWVLKREPRPHVVVLQETGAVWARPLERLRAAFPHAMTRYREDNFGMVVLSRLPGSLFSRAEDGPGEVPVIRLDARSPATGRPLTLFAVHPPPPLGGALTRLRDGELAHVGARVEAVAPTRRVLVVGDLNATPWSAAYRALLRETRLTHGRRLPPLLGTWPGFLPAWAGIPIDHLLVSPGLALMSREVGPTLGSDHRVVVSTVAVVPGPRTP